MAINLHGTSGAIIFVVILVFLQIFFGLIGSLISTIIGLTGYSYWIMVGGIVLILDLIFINKD